MLCCANEAIAVTAFTKEGGPFLVDGVICRSCAEGLHDPEKVKKGLMKAVPNNSSLRGLLGGPASGTSGKARDGGAGGAGVYSVVDEEQDENPGGETAGAETSGGGVLTETQIVPDNYNVSSGVATEGAHSASRFEDAGELHQEVFVTHVCAAGRSDGNTSCNFYRAVAVSREVAGVLSRRIVTMELAGRSCSCTTTPRSGTNSQNGSVTPALGVFRSSERSSCSEDVEKSPTSALSHHGVQLDIADDFSWLSGDEEEQTPGTSSAWSYRRTKAARSTSRTNCSTNKIQIAETTSPFHDDLREGSHQMQQQQVQPPGGAFLMTTPTGDPLLNASGQQIVVDMYGRPIDKDGNVIGPSIVPNAPQPPGGGGGAGVAQPGMQQPAQPGTTSQPAFQTHINCKSVWVWEDATCHATFGLYIKPVLHEQQKRSSFCHAERAFLMRFEHQKSPAECVMLGHASQTSCVMENMHDFQTQTFLQSITQQSMQPGTMGFNQYGQNKNFPQTSTQLSGTAKPSDTATSNLHLYFQQSLAILLKNAQIQAKQRYSNCARLCCVFCCTCCGIIVGLLLAGAITAAASSNLLLTEFDLEENNENRAIPLSVAGYNGQIERELNLRTGTPIYGPTSDIQLPTDRDKIYIANRTADIDAEPDIYFRYHFRELKKNLLMKSVDLRFQDIGSAQTKVNFNSVEQFPMYMLYQIGEEHVASLASINADNTHPQLLKRTIPSSSDFVNLYTTKIPLLEKFGYPVQKYRTRIAIMHYKFSS